MFDVLSVAKQAGEMAVEIEKLGHLPAALAEQLTETGLMRAFAPAELGGLEATPAAVSNAIESIAYYDGSTGWAAMISSTTSLAAGYIDPEWSERIYGDPRSITGGFAAPVGRATVCDGGLTVSGQWQWGSGSHNCTWLGGGTIIVDSHGDPAPRSDGLRMPFTFFAPDQFELLDTWHVAGLKGTGSTDYAVTEAFVPEGRWMQIGDEPTIDRPTYRFPFYGALAVGVSSVMLGLAHRAIDELIDVAATKKPTGSSRTLAERSVVQSQLAEAIAAHRSARTFLDSAIATAWDAAQAGAVPDQCRFDLRLATSQAARASVQAVDLCYHAAGGGAVYDTSPLQRVFRDVHVAIQHAMVAPRTFEVLGRNQFGLPTSVAQI